MKKQTMHVRSSYSSIILGIVIAVLSICLSWNFAYAAEKTLKIKNDNVSLITGETLTLTTNLSVSKKKWTSSNPAVASVDQKGIVKAKKIGSTTITLRASGKTAKCKIKVVSGIELSDYFNINENYFYKVFPMTVKQGKNKRGDFLDIEAHHVVWNIQFNSEGAIPGYRLCGVKIGMSEADARHLMDMFKWKLVSKSSPSKSDLELHYQKAYKDKTGYIGDHLDFVIEFKNGKVVSMNYGLPEG